MLKSARVGFGIRGRRPAVFLLGEPTPQVPSNSVAPVISGQLKVGEDLTATTGTWSQSPTGYSYQWYSDGSPVGTDSNTYTITSGDLFVPIYVEVTAENAVGPGTPANSNTVYVDESLRQWITGTVFDLDATITESYDGVDTYWRNLVFAPNDGATQAAYDMEPQGTMFFSGSGGDPTDYWLINSTGDRFLIDAATTFTNALHKTTGGTDFWLAFNGRFIQSDLTQMFISTQNSSTSNGLAVASGSNENLRLGQGNGSASITASSAGAAVVNDTDYMIICTYQASTGTVKIYRDTSTPFLNTTIAFGTTTTNSSGLSVGAEPDGGSFCAVNTRIYAAAGGNTYLSDSDVQAIIDEWTARHTPLAAGFDLALLNVPASYTNTLDCTTIGGITNVNDFCFSPDGTKLYIADANAGTTTYIIHQCDLSTPWDVTTAVEIATLDVESISTQNKIDIGVNGTRLFLSVGTEISTFAMSPAYDITSVNLGSPIHTTSGLALTQRFSYCNTAVFDIFAVIGTSSIKGYEAAGPSSATFATLQGTNALGAYVNPDGTKLWVCNNTGDIVYQYTFGTPGDVATLTYDSISFAVGAIGLTTPRQIRWSEDGQHFFLVSDSNLVMWDLA